MYKLTLKKWLTIISALCIFLSACTAPVETTPPVIINTASPAITFTPVHTSTPEATFTATETPAPTLTFTPVVTETQLPEMPSAAEGKGNVVGLVLWNNQPVPNTAILLCGTFSGKSCSGAHQFSTRTDKDGYYFFKDVDPGRYVLATESFGSYLFITYSDDVDVSTGQTSVLDPWHIWKYDLQAITPKTQEFINEEKPVFRWEAYPDAAYYEISIVYSDFTPVIWDVRIDSPEFIPMEPLSACSYQWWVHAYNSNGNRIATTRLSELAFSVINVPNKC